MEDNFRSAVFKLCNKLSQRQEANTIHEAIRDLSVVKSEGTQEGVFQRPAVHGDLAYISRNQHLQFLGYLLIDESVDKINEHKFFRVTKLSDEERYPFEMGYLTTTFFIDSCISELSEKWPIASQLLNPYVKYQEPKIRTNAKSFLNKEDIEECVSSFCNSDIYKKIYSNDALLPIERSNSETVKQLSAVQEKQFINDLKSPTKETKDYIFKIQNNRNLEIPEITQTYLILCESLRVSLVNAVQLIYESIIGDDLLVMNNNCVINFSGPQSDLVYKKYNVLIQDNSLLIKDTEIGNVVLLKIDLNEKQHIKEFGSVISLTFSTDQEFGSSTKIGMITVDDDLNPIHNLTDIILSSDIGRASVKYDATSNKMSVLPGL